ncbi:MAG TPA: tetratricopeptide repeat protein, partial [Bacteroidales bacterium]|nr:tetratricopeptide repeat protein [Bacteroidales bacterium]
YLFRGLRLRESTEGAVSTGPLLHSIGDVYDHLNNFPIALEYYKRAFLFFKQAGIKRGISQTSNNIGNIYKLTGNYLQALEYYRLALEIDREFGYQQEVSESLNNIALLHVRLNQPTEAIAAYTEALEIAEKKNDIHNQIVALKGLGNLYADNRDFSRSEQSLYQALKLAQQNENRNDLMEIYQSLALIYSKAGNFQRAYEHQVEYTRLNNQIYDVNSRLISEIEARYELEKHKQQLDAVIKESEINELQLRKSQMIVYGVSVLLLTIIIIALLLVRQNRLNMRQKVINLEQKLFRSQMNPHFIYNALGAIQSFMYKRETAEAGKYLSNFAKLMRLVLNNSRAEYVTLENEIQTLGYYIELQRMRFDNKFDYQFEVDSKINPSVICIPPMLAQPLIENSVEHGIQHLSTKGLISIRFKLNNGTVLFEIEDNGIGIAKSKKIHKSHNDHESLAISITEERLRLLNRKHSNKIQLKISECQNALGETVGTRITFNIPYILPANNNNNVMFAAKAI